MSLHHPGKGSRRPVAMAAGRSHLWSVEQPAVDTTVRLIDGSDDAHEVEAAGVAGHNVWVDTGVRGKWIPVMSKLHDFSTALIPH